MKKRLLSLGMALSMVLTLVPISAFAEENSEVQTCICEAVCTEETRNTDCPVCGAEGAALEDCGKYVAPVTEMPTEEANTETSVETEVQTEAPTETENQSEPLVCICEAVCVAEAMNADCPICGAEGATIENCGKYVAPVEETEPEQTAVDKVQTLINALPDADSITEENRADVEAQLTAIDEAKLPLGDELDALDFSKYNDAIVALNELDGMGGAEVPEMLEDTLQGNGTEADPWILTKEILDSKFSYSSLGATSYKLNSGMYRLGEDITVTDNIRIYDATVTLDLNGYKLLSIDSKQLFYVNQNTVGVTSRLTLVDGSSGKTGEVRNNTGNVVFMGIYTEFDGNSVPLYGRVSNWGTLSGGVFHGDVVGTASNATITGGTFHGAVSFSGTITGGIFYGAVDAGTRINDSAKVTVSFSSDGWTGTQKVLRGQKASEPTRDGCTCTGCYTDSTYTTAFDFDTAITTDTTLYAKWYCIGTHVDENPKDHKCDLCKATLSTCSGGTATCKDKAVCDYCGKPYGELNGSTHAGGTHIKNDKAATCNEDGYTGDAYCKGCETKLQDGKPITKLGHIDDDKNHVCDRENCKATLSTCSGGTATCKDKAVCDYCGKPYGELDSSNHAGGTEVRNAKDATCTEDGYTGDTYCKGCETKLSSGKSVDKTGHDYESKVTKEATTTSTGTKTYTCKNCGHSYEEEIAKLPSQSTSPKTGDETPLAMTIAVTIFSAVALAVLLFLNKKRKVN